MNQAVAWKATRHGHPVGWGSSPELAARAAERVGITRCDVEPAPWASYWATLQARRETPFRSERELLEKLLAAAHEERQGMVEFGCEDEDLAAVEARVRDLRRDLRGLDDAARQGVLLPPPPLAPVGLRGDRLDS